MKGEGVVGRHASSGIVGKEPEDSRSCWPTHGPSSVGHDCDLAMTLWSGTPNCHAGAHTSWAAPDSRHASHPRPCASETVRIRDVILGRVRTHGLRTAPRAGRVPLRTMQLMVVIASKRAKTSVPPQRCARAGTAGSLRRGRNRWTGSIHI
jgi:hypothetical protein